MTMPEMDWPSCATLARWEAASEADVYEELSECGAGDGLPIVRPTKAALHAFLEPHGFSGTELIARVPPFEQEASTEALAVCAILAGCQPAHLPVLCAIVRALADPKLNAIGILSTTGSVALAIIINGPIRSQLAFNAAGNCLGPGVRSNATVGRALGFVTRGLGGSIPGIGDMSTMGQPGKYTFCIAENEEQSPWEPLHVERGFARDESTVTLVGAAGTIEVVNTFAHAPPEMLDELARTMAGTSGALLDAESTIGGGQPLVLTSPEWARTFETHGLAKSDLKRMLFQKALRSLESLPAKQADEIRRQRREAVYPADAPLRIALRPEDIHIVVTGGVGIKQTYVPSWSGGSGVVTVRV